MLTKSDARLLAALMINLLYVGFSGSAPASSSRQAETPVDAPGNITNDTGYGVLGPDGSSKAWKSILCGVPASNISITQELVRNANLGNHPRILSSSLHLNKVNHVPVKVWEIMWFGEGRCFGVQKLQWGWTSERWQPKLGEAACPLVPQALIIITWLWPLMRIVIFLILRMEKQRPDRMTNLGQKQN